MRVGRGAARLSDQIPKNPPRVTLAEQGKLQFVTALTQDSKALERSQQVHQEGPCRDAYESGEVVRVTDVRQESARWPDYSALATELGVAGVAGTPMRHGDEVIGALNIYSSEPRQWSDEDIAVAVVLADVATGYVLNASKLHDQEQLSEQLQKALESRIVRVRKDGSVFPVSLTISPICGPDGAIVGTSMISRDMTDLRHAVRYARSLIEASVDPLVTISPEGKITDVNEASVKVTGIARDELIGTDFSQHFTDPDKAHEGYQRAFEHGSLIDYPLTLIHEDGKLTDVLYNVSVYRDFNDKVLGLVAVARDAAQLREQQQLSEQLQEALESRIVIEQAKGITAHRHRVTIDQAYQRIRTHARNNNTSLRKVAEAIVEVGLEV